MSRQLPVDDSSVKGRQIKTLVFRILDEQIHSKRTGRHLPAA
jgi:hypothetical protein